MKQCGECRACCRGSMAVEVHGQKVQPGNPCRFISAAGCEIYDDDPLPRPEPCKQFTCVWLRHDSLKDYMRPDRCGIILVRNHSAPVVNVVITRNNFDRHAYRYIDQWAAEKNYTLKKMFLLVDPPGT